MFKVEKKKEATKMEIKKKKPRKKSKWRLEKLG